MESFDLSRHLSQFFFSSKAIDRSKIFSKELKTISERVTDRPRWVRPGEFCASPLLLGINAICDGRRVNLQPCQPRDELFCLFLDIFAFLRDCQWQVEVTWNDPTS